MRKGQTVTEATRKRMSLASKERAAREIALGIRHPALGMKHTEEFKQMVSKMFKGKKLSKAHRRKIGEANKRNNNARWLKPLKKGETPVWAQGKQTGPKGYRWPLSRRIALGEKQRGSQSNFWRGGTTREDTLARQSLRYVEWRKAVLARDERTCRDCGKPGNHAHHLVSFLKDHRLRFAVENGETLCASCHRRRESIVHRANGVNSGKASRRQSRAEPSR